MSIEKKANNEKPPDKPVKAPPLKEGGLIKGQYEVVSLLGHGGFDSVFKVRDKRTKKLYALKLELEKPKEDEAGVELEVSVLKLLQNNIRFLRYIDNGKLNENDFVIMQLAGKNLAELRKSCPKKRFTEATSYRLAEQTLDAIEAMHSSGLLHRDIKPANFAIGCTDADAKNVYLLDFGLVRQYRTKDGTLRAPRQKTGFRGTTKYASINCHKNLDLGRHDDLWCWLYMIFEFLKGDLPWQLDYDKNKVLEIKEKSKVKLVEDMEAELEQIYDNLTPLTYNDEPPYHGYRTRLYQVMQRKNHKSNEPYDWEPGGAYCKEATSVCDQPYQKQLKSKQRVIKEKIPEDNKNAAPTTKPTVA